MGSWLVWIGSDCVCWMVGDGLLVGWLARILAAVVRLGEEGWLVGWLGWSLSRLGRNGWDHWFGGLAG